jgi:phospholipase C
LQAALHKPIQHVIVIVQQTRSFDNLFAGFPNADAPTKGLTSKGKYVALERITLEQSACRFRGSAFEVAYHEGKMDGWNLLDRKHPLCPYTRIDGREIQTYWDLAKCFTIDDHMFESTHFGEFIDSLYMITGTTKIARNTYIAGPPDGIPWGCDAPPGTVTPILKNGKFELFAGPYPCFDQFPSIANLLDKARVGWKYYYNAGVTPQNPFDAIKYVRLGRDWTHNMRSPAKHVLSDIANGDLAPVSWVLSPLGVSDFPGFAGGPRWVNSIVRALQKSAYWPHTAIVIAWNSAADGVFYDDVPPPQLDPMGLGFRVPMIVVSPYAKRGYVSHTQYEFGSILKFIEENWHLGSLGATDVRANSIGDVLELNQ